MKAWYLLAGVLLATLGLAGPADAQDVHRFEVFGGYALSRQQDEANLNGWHAQAAFNLTPSLGLVADVSAHYMGDEDFVPGVAGLSDTRIVSYSVGPRAYNREGPVSLFTHALFGQSRVVGQADIGASLTERRVLRPFTVTLGGGVDVTLADHILLRVAEIDYRLLRIESTNSHGFRLSTGVTLAF
jgi:hypothetical protein